MKRFWRHGLAAVLVAVALGSIGTAVCSAADPVVGGTVLAPNQKLLAKRAAQLDAYRLLAERIMGLQITADTTVRDFVAERDQICTMVDTLIKGVRLGEPRYFDDGTCEVDAEVTLAQVVTTLQKAYDEVYKGGRWKRADFENITKSVQYTKVTVTGNGAVRAASTVPDPATAPVVAPLARPQAQHIELPAIFRKVPPNERLKAKRAAQLDAYRLLMERIQGLRLSADTTVRDFTTAQDRIGTSVEGYLKGVRHESVRYCDDGTVEVQASVTLAEVVVALQKAYDDVYKGGRWTRNDIENITKTVQFKTVTVVGTGAISTDAGAGGATGGSTIIIPGNTVIVDPGDPPTRR